MPYANNRSSYNTRNTSGRYNTTGQFVPAASEQQQQPSNNTLVQTTNLQQRLQNAAGNGATQNNQFGQLYSPAAQAQKVNVNQPLQTVDVKMEEATDTSAEAAKPGWMKSKLAGVKKISNKERRRRQNESLRRLLTPKNALMVLNEMMPGEAVANQFKVGPAQTTQYFNKNINTSFCADLTVEGTNYKGYGENKMTARNAAAEQAIRDYIIKRMAKVMGGATDTASVVSAGGESADGDEEALPMIQLASFALHKLFSEWEYEGHKVPQLKPPTGPPPAESAMAVDGAPAPAPKPKTVKPKTLPVNARAMHPAMLLTYMRPRIEYKQLAVDGDKPQAMMYTIGVDVDGLTYIGKAANKKEARRAAAKAACNALFNITFDEVATATAPVVS